MHARRKTRILVAVAVTAAGVLTVGGTPADGAPASPGGQSAGDSLFPTIGNTGYDVLHYGVRLRFSKATGRIHAGAAITSRARHPLSSYSFDLEGLHVRRVMVDGRAARFSRHADKLVVTPARPCSVSRWAR